MITSIVEWFDFTKAVSLVALGISSLSLYFSWERSRLAKMQETRRTPNLILSCEYGQFQDGQEERGRLYTFELLISNRTDDGNAIARASLSITYLTESRLQMKMKFLAIDTPQQEALMLGEHALPIPIRIDAHSSVSGRIYFQVPAKMLTGNTIEKYEILLTDTHDKTYIVEETFLQEVRNAEA